MNIVDIANRMKYPGRFLILKHMEDSVLALYGVTARNAASKAKRYVYDEAQRKAYVVPTDAETMAQGDLSLLDYTALTLFDTGLVIGNGRQTEAIQALNTSTAREQLISNLSEWSYEHDKYATPRITACTIEQDGALSVAMHHILKGDDNTVIRQAYDIPADGQGYFLSTYAGPNIRPTPSFTASPISISFAENIIELAVSTVYDAFAPLGDADDLRVSVVGVEYRIGGESTVYVHNAII